ncbi:Crp/Fnr family transcriptional regulator [Spongiimicrobium salis]|uniref:Crp/Fnr family transcriptional regulator n=1 Tax=Spongiimicrobium salis TaxID=1667022 RepID=UPI00374DD4F6
MNTQAFFQHLGRTISLSDEEIALISARIKNRTYLKGQYMVQQGDSCHYLNFLISGSVKTFHIDAQGKEHIFRFAIENWWTTDLPSFIQKGIANTSVQCLEKTEVVQISLAHLEVLYKEVPPLEYFFRTLFQNVSISLEKRIIYNLSYSAKERYLLFREEYPQFEQRIPQYMIASYLGISKQYLSEIRNQLAFDH